ncbi:hypothetical protein K491DRAFT_494216 [Lophiostoma macrostomum CBS 122681]|uniref:Uncharacterized protein n=1 Tax=Lophiostoma macrostomum CBS 122681 TaxID=1314788 RepID=A0A6A6T2M0_9PLEO|nr:hypothetical protein K491DRAFT_494216 [Lophiostoma macrostomum CBS 122681]
MVDHDRSIHAAAILCCATVAARRDGDKRKWADRWTSYNMRIICRHPAIAHSRSQMVRCTYHQLQWFDHTNKKPCYTFQPFKAVVPKCRHQAPPFSAGSIASTQIHGRRMHALTLQRADWDPRRLSSCMLRWQRIQRTQGAIRQARRDVGRGDCSTNQRRPWRSSPLASPCGC